MRPETRRAGGRGTCENMSNYTQQRAFTFSSRMSSADSDTGFSIAMRENTCIIGTTAKSTAPESVLAAAKTILRATSGGENTQGLSGMCELCT